MTLFVGCLFSDLSQSDTRRETSHQLFVISAPPLSFLYFRVWPWLAIWRMNPSLLHSLPLLGPLLLFVGDKPHQIHHRLVPPFPKLRKVLLVDPPHLRTNHQ